MRDPSAESGGRCVGGWSIDKGGIFLIFLIHSVIVSPCLLRSKAVEVAEMPPKISRFSTVVLACHPPPHSRLIPPLVTNRKRIAQEYRVPKKFMGGSERNHAEIPHP